MIPFQSTYISCQDSSSCFSRNVDSLDDDRGLRAVRVYVSIFWWIPLFQPHSCRWERAASDLHVNEVNEKHAVQIIWYRARCALYTGKTARDEVNARPTGASVQFPPHSLILDFVSISLTSEKVHLGLIGHTFQNSVEFHLETAMDAQVLNFGGCGGVRLTGGALREAAIIIICAACGSSRIVTQG